jgi:ribosome-associated heat shock protein Hsp15
VSDDACRVDVWLWRARFFKTRGLAARAVEAGRIRLNRDTGDVRLDKPSRAVRAGDRLVFALGGRLTCVRVETTGERRGPALEARGLYSELPAEDVRPG